MLILKTRPSSKIVSDIENKIRTGLIAPGEQLAPEGTLATYYKTSLRGVRSALLELESKNIVSREKGRGTFVKQMSGKPHTNKLSVGIILNKMLCIHNMTMLSGITKIFQIHNIASYIIETEHSLEKEVEAVKEYSRNCDGLILLSVASEESISHLMPFRDESKINNIVLVDRFFHGVSLNCVACDHFDGTYKAALHLYSNGYKRLAYVGSSHKIFSVHERIMGFMKAVQNKSPSESPLVFQKGVDMFAAGYEAVEEIVKNNIADAIVCENDDIAIGAFDFMKRNKIVPGRDFGVIGFGNMESIMQSGIGLSSVNANFYETGRRAAMLLYENLNNHEMNKDVHKIILPIEIVERESSQRS